jgi:DNA-binding transcriptional MerR regulator
MNKIYDDHQGRLSIGQVSAATGINRSTLRHWEREFRDYLDTAIEAGPPRRFAPDAVEKVDKIRDLIQEEGLTLRGVRLELEKLSGKQFRGLDPPEEASPIESKAKSLADRVTERLVSRLFEP